MSDCPDCARLRTESEQLREELVLAIAHDRQPYPTADAYERVCAALHRAEAERDALAAAMPSEGADAALAYAAMKTERDAAVARAERYRRAVIDLAERGYGVRRPQWLIAAIDAARKGSANG